MNAVEVSNYLKENVNVDGSARTVRLKRFRFEELLKAKETAST
jgi:hypothetical protein